MAMHDIRTPVDRRLTAGDANRDVAKRSKAPRIVWPILALLIPVRGAWASEELSAIEQPNWQMGARHSPGDQPQRRTAAERAAFAFEPRRQNLVQCRRIGWHQQPDIGIEFRQHPREC